MRFLGILLATLFTGLFISLFASSSVNAQSAYDDVIDLFPSISILDKNSPEGATYDITTSYIGLFNNTYIPQNLMDAGYNDFWESSTPCDFNTANNKHWALVVQTDGSDTPDTLFLYYTNNDVSLEFTDDGLMPDDSVNRCDLSLGGWMGDVVVTGHLEESNDPIAFSPYVRPVFINFPINYPEDYQGEIPPDSYEPPTKTPVWLNYAVKFIEGEKITIQSNNWTNYRDRHGGGIRYGDVGGTSDITLCRIEDKDNTGCVETLAFIDDRAGPITLEYPKTLIGQVGYYKVFIDNTNKEPKIPPFDEEDYPFDVKNRSIIVFNDGTSTVTIDTVGYYEDESYFPQYDDNVYYNKFMNHDLVDDHGLLNVVLAPLGYLSQLPDVTCQPLTLPMPSRFGEDISLPCMTESVYQPQFPQIFQMYQLLITAVFSYMVGLRLFQNVKEMSSEKDDSIEVVKL